MISIPVLPNRGITHFLLPATLFFQKKLPPYHLLLHCPPGLLPVFTPPCKNSVIKAQSRSEDYGLSRKYIHTKSGSSPQVSWVAGKKETLLKLEQIKINHHVLSGIQRAALLEVQLSPENEAAV